MVGQAKAVFRKHANHVADVERLQPNSKLKAAAGAKVCIAQFKVLLTRQTSAGTRHQSAGTDQRPKWTAMIMREDVGAYKPTIGDQIRIDGVKTQNGDLIGGRLFTLVDWSEPRYLGTFQILKLDLEATDSVE